MTRSKIKTVALVDDEEVFHWITRQFIQRLDMEVEILSFYNGREAMDFLLKKTIKLDILTLDLNMPIANGWVFLDEYSKSDLENTFPIYVVTSSIDPEDQKKARAYECVADFISKPLSIELLEKVLNQPNL